MKNRMKKLLVLATAATMMTAAFTGCGSSSDGADNNADTSADEAEAMAKDFISKSYGDKYLSTGEGTKKSSKNIQALVQESSQ